MRLKPLLFIPSLLLFGIPSGYFFIIAYILIPYLNNTLHLHPLLSWVTGGYFLFIPLFIIALVLLKREGYSLKWKDIIERFRLVKLDRKGWIWTAAGTGLTFILTGLLYFIIKTLVVKNIFQGLTIVPPFLQFEPLQGINRLILLVWLPMFFFNIVGEEFLWRGYILPRQELAFGKYAWAVNALLWLLFHLGFGAGQILIILPILLILPYIAQKTKSTIPGIVMHGLLNGPMFVVISLGFIG